jgi:hypothetical protein
MQPLSTTYVSPLPFNVAQAQGRNSADPAYWLPRTGYRLPGDGPGVNGYGVFPLLALIPLVVPLIYGGTQIGKDTAAKAREKRAIDQKLRETVPCIAELDAKITKLKKAKGVKGKQKQLKTLKNRREQFALNPALCKPEPDASFQPSTAPVVASAYTPPTTSAPDAGASGLATPSVGTLVVGGAAVLGSIAVLAAILRR